MADLPALANKIEARRAFSRENSKWGLMPIQRRGLGLVLTVLAVASLIAVVIAFIAGAGSGWTTALIAVLVLSNGVNIYRTNKWVETQIRTASSGN